MKNFISSKHKHLLHKDECNHQFLLLKNMEIFRKSKTTLGVYCWSKKVFSQLKKEGVIFNEFITDDNLYTFEVENTKLPRLFETGIHSRRIHHNGRWLKDKEKRLGHRIFRFSPRFKQSVFVKVD